MRSSKRIILFFLSIFLFCLSPAKAEEGFTYPDDLYLERDPFDPLINSEGIINIKLVRRIGDLDLNGIIYSKKEEERAAIINNSILKKGQYIGSYKIDEITATSVVLDRKGDKTVLEMKGVGDE